MGSIISTASSSAPPLNRGQGSTLASSASDPLPAHGVTFGVKFGYIPATGGGVGWGVHSALAGLDPQLVPGNQRPSTSWKCGTAV